MPSMTGHYDESLLAAAPAATKAQLQEGYTTELLNPSQEKVTTPIPAPAPAASTHDPERGQASTGQPAPKQPFWRTKKGIIAIAVAFLVIIAVVIGGAVGGTRHKHKAVPTLSQGGGDSSTPVGSSPDVAGSGPNVADSPNSVSGSNSQSASSTTSSTPSSSTSSTTVQNGLGVGLGVGPTPLSQPQSGLVVGVLDTGSPL